jgi:hypothetical protein
MSVPTKFVTEAGNASPRLISPRATTVFFARQLIFVLQESVVVRAIRVPEAIRATINATKPGIPARKPEQLAKMACSARATIPARAVHAQEAVIPAVRGIPATTPAMKISFIVLRRLVPIASEGNAMLPECVCWTKVVPATRMLTV